MRSFKNRTQELEYVNILQRRKNYDSKICSLCDKGEKSQEMIRVFQCDESEAIILFATAPSIGFMVLNDLFFATEAVVSRNGFF